MLKKNDLNRRFIRLIALWMALAVLLSAHGNVLATGPSEPSAAGNVTETPADESTSGSDQTGESAGSAGNASGSEASQGNDSTGNGSVTDPGAGDNGSGDPTTPNTTDPSAGQGNGTDSGNEGAQVSDPADSGQINGSDPTDPSQGDPGNSSAGNESGVTGGENTTPTGGEDLNGSAGNETLDANTTNSSQDADENETDNLTDDNETNATNETRTEPRRFYPTFNRSVNIDGMTVQVYAEEGVFPESATLSVEKVAVVQPAQAQAEKAAANAESPEVTYSEETMTDGSATAGELEKIENAVSEVREENVRVSVAYTFDIKVLDADGTELQPEDPDKVRVSFSMKEIANENLSMQIYHLREDDTAQPLENVESAELPTPEETAQENEALRQALEAEALEAETEGENATVEADGFSYYTVEFAYGTMSYYLCPHQEVTVFAILRYLHFNFTSIDNVTINDDSGLRLWQDEEGDYMVSAEGDSFENAILTVVLDGVAYNVDLIYDGVDNRAVIEALGYIRQGGSLDTAGDDSFIKDIPIQSISIKDLATITPELRYGTAGTLATGSTIPGFVRVDSGSTQTVYWGGSGASQSMNNMGGGTYLVGISSGGTPVLREFKGQYYYYRYPDAATLPDGTTADVIVKFENIKNYSTGTLGWVAWSNAAYGDQPYPSLWPYSLSGNPVGVQADVTVMVVESGTQTPVDTTGLTNGSFIYGVRGLELNRDNTSAYHGIDSAGSYTDPPVRTGSGAAAANYNFSEAVRLDMTTTAGDIYIPQQSDSGLFIDADGSDARFVAATGGIASDPYAPASDSYGTGLVTLGRASGTKLTAWSSSRNDAQEGTAKDYRGVYFVTPAAHTVTATSGAHGSISLWDNGMVYVDDGDVPTGVHKLIDEGTNGAWTYSVPDGKPVTYMLTPAEGYKLKSLKVNGRSVQATEVADPSASTSGTSTASVLAPTALLSAPVSLLSDPAPASSPTRDGSGDATPAYYTYTLPADASGEITLSATWTKSDETEPQGCDDATAYEMAVMAASIKLDYGNLQDRPTVTVSTNFQTDSNMVRLNNGSSTSGYWKALLDNAYYNFGSETTTLTYPNAAVLSDGTKSDVIVTISGISMYTPQGITPNGGSGGPSTSTINMKPTIVGYDGGPSITARMLSTNFSQYPYGLVETVNIRVAGASPDDTFVFTADGIDGSGDSTIYGATSNANYAEYIHVTGGSDTDVTPVDSGSTRVYLADAYNGITFTATSSGSPTVTNVMQLLPEMAVREMTFTAVSGDGGSISPSGTTTNPYVSDMIYTLTAGKTNRKNNVVDQLFIDGAEVADPSSVLVGTGIPDGNGNYPAYTYTFPKCSSDPRSIEVTWKAPPITPPTTYPECDDCKNPDPCNDCYNSLYGLDIRGYDKDANGVYRGGNAASRVSSMTAGTYFSGDTADSNTFASTLPYANVFVDTTKISWKNSNSGNFHIILPDSRFKLVGTGQTSEGPSMYPSLANSSYSDLVMDADLIQLSDVGSPSGAVPAVAYYGPIHSYLMYGTEKAETEPTSEGERRTLVRKTRDNTVASTENIADGLYTVTEDGQSYTVDVKNGTNVITPQAGNDYLYRVIYDDAVVLQDGSRGKLVLTATKLELESSYTSPGNVYIGLQRENQIGVHSDFVKEGVTPVTTNQDTKNASKYIPGRETFATDGGNRTVRNAVGAKVTFEIKVLYADGTPLEEGSIAYGANDLDLPSFESIWGRQPADTYAGTDQSIATDPVKSKWTGTHEFYEYAEGMQINSGALSYALVPNYDHGNAGGNNWENGDLPIDRALPREDRYYVPLQVIATTASTDGLANGARFVTTSAGKNRDNSGTFSNNGTNCIDLTNTYNVMGQTWVGNRNDGETYDTGFAVLLDASGSELVWTGSNHTNGTVNTTLFDSNFSTYIIQSHGTGGGIHLENYKVADGCEPSYIEGVAVFGIGATATVSIVPEDGYRVKQFYVDDVKITVDEENDTITIGNGTPAALAVGGDITVTDFYTSRNSSAPIRTLTVKRYADGTYDVGLSNAEQGTSVHADFEADYYFHKVWEGGKADKGQIPGTLYMTAVPYTAEHDSVVLDGATYQISRDPVSGKTIFTRVSDDPSQAVSYIVESDPNNLRTLHSGKHPAGKYPTVTIGTAPNAVTYVIMGNDIYRAVYGNVEDISTGTTLNVITGVDESTITPISVKFERYVDDAHIHKTEFTVTSTGSGVETLDVGGDVVWRVKYPDAGDAQAGWPALPIEVEDNDAASPTHHTEETHVKRIYWFVTEDIDKLGDKWNLENYENTYDNGEATMAGIASYMKNYRLAYDGKTYWYTLSTKDHADTDAAKGDMAKVNLAYMAPISEKIMDKSGYAYAGYGGRITNRVIETKLRAFKRWIDGGQENYRNSLKMVVKRTYNYSQPSDVPSGARTITFPSGPVMNTVMGTIAGGLGNIRTFKQDVEPLLAYKAAAKEIDANGAPLDGSTLGAGDYVLYKEGDVSLYLWFNNATQELCFWTNSDPEYVYLNANASGMFRNMTALKDIPGAGAFNLSRTTNLAGMFEIENGTGSLEALDYMRKWDVRNVTDLSRFAAGQQSLHRINGIVDWNIAAAVAADKDNAFKNIFQGGHPSVCNGVKNPFIFYPHFVVKTDGDLDVSVTTTADADVNDLIYDVDGPQALNIGTLVKNGNEWTWEIMELLVSDAKKWEYKIYEDAMLEYRNLDGALKYENRKEMLRDPDSGYYEYRLINKLSTYDLVISKTVKGNMGSRDKYFKFTAEFTEAGDMTRFDLGTSQMPKFPRVNDATTPSYYDKRYTYVKKDGTVAVSNTKEALITSLELTDEEAALIQESTVIGVANARDDDPTSGTIRYDDTSLTTDSDKKDLVWEVKDGQGSVQAKYKYVPAEWQAVTSASRASVAAPPDVSIIEYKDIQSAEQREVARYHTWLGDNGSIAYTYTATTATWQRQVAGTIEDLAGEPPQDAYATYETFTGKNGTSGFTDQQLFKWKDSNGTTYEYITEVWMKLVSDGAGGWVYENTTPSTSTVPPNHATANYTGRTDQQIITRDGAVTYEFYLQSGQQVVIRDLPHGAKYNIHEEDYTEDGYTTSIKDGTGKTLVAEHGVDTAGQAGVTAEISDSGTYYLRTERGIGGALQYEEPGDYYAEYDAATMRTDLSLIPRYVKNADGTYTASTDGTYYLTTDGRYYETPPEGRYESLTTRYNLNVTRAYTNRSEVVVPTEVRLGFAAGLLGPVMLVLVVLRFYLENRRRRRALQYAGRAGHRRRRRHHRGGRSEDDILDLLFEDLE